MASRVSYLNPSQIFIYNKTTELTLVVGPKSIKERLVLPVAYAIHYSNKIRSSLSTDASLKLIRLRDLHPISVSTWVEIITQQKWPATLMTFNKVLADEDRPFGIPETNIDVIVAVCETHGILNGNSGLISIEAAAALEAFIKRGVNNINLIEDRHIATILCLSCEMDEVKQILAKVVARFLSIHNRAVDTYDCRPQGRTAPIFKFPSFIKNDRFHIKVLELEGEIQRKMTEQTTRLMGKCLITDKLFIMEDF